MYANMDTHNVIGGLAQKTVNEVAASKRSSNQRRYLLSIRCLDANLIAHMNKHLVVTEGNQREFTKV